MLPELHYSSDAGNNYFEGMAYLTAEKIFADVYFEVM